MNTAQKEEGVLRVHKKYFRSRVVLFLFAIVLFHTAIMVCEVAYSSHARYLLSTQSVPGDDKKVEKLMEKKKKVYKQQSSALARNIMYRVLSIVSKAIDLAVVISFFSHGIRQRIYDKLHERKSIVRINCTHIREVDVNFIVLALAVITTKNTCLTWIASKTKSLMGLCTSLAVIAFRSVLIVPVIIWMFSSVYNKTRWGLILSGYLATIILIFIANCTELIPEMTDGLEIIPVSAFGKELRDEIVRLNLKNKIFWDRAEQAENAALVKTGASRYILVFGDLLKYGKEEFVAFIAHEVGHADDLSTEKKLLATVFVFGLTCGGIISALYFLTPKYESRGVSRFSVLTFVMLANIYIVSLLTNMFYNNLSILAEVNADLYAKRLNFGMYLARGLYSLTVESSGGLFHSLIYTHYMQDHPTVASRIGYLYE